LQQRNKMRDRQPCNKNHVSTLYLLKNEIVWLKKNNYWIKTYKTLKFFIWHIFLYLKNSNYYKIYIYNKAQSFIIFLWYLMISYNDLIWNMMRTMQENWHFFLWQKKRFWRSRSSILFFSACSQSAFLKTSKTYLCSCRTLKCHIHMQEATKERCFKANAKAI